MSKNLKTYLGEFFAAFFICAFGLGFIADLVLGHCASLFELSIWFAIVFAMGEVIFGGISGCHVTPGVTICCALFLGFDKKKVLPYIIAQILGWGLGIIPIYLVFGTALTDQCAALGINPANLFYCSTTSVPLYLGGVVEFFISAFMMIGIFAVVDPRLPAHPSAAAKPFAIGAVIAVCVNLGGGISGGCINAARDLGPRLVSLVYGLIMGYDVSGIFAGGQWLMYIIAPTCGALFGGFVFYKVFLKLLPAKAE